MEKPEQPKTAEEHQAWLHQKTEESIKAKAETQPPQEGHTPFTADPSQFHKKEEVKPVKKAGRGTGTKPA